MFVLGMYVDDNLILLLCHPRRRWHCFHRLFVFLVHNRLWRYRKRNFADCVLYWPFRHPHVTYRQELPWEVSIGHSAYVHAYVPVPPAGGECCHEGLAWAQAAMQQTPGGRMYRAKFEAGIEPGGWGPYVHT